MRDSWFYLLKATGQLKYGGTDVEFQKFCGIIFIVNCKGKSKIHPRTSHEGPEGSGVIALLFL
jgi:hypothetical protein